MKKLFVIGALLVPLCVNAGIRCNKDGVTYGPDTDSGKVLWCKDYKKPCYTPEKFYERCRYGHSKEDDLSYKKHIDFETGIQNALLERQKKAKADFAAMEKAIAAKKAAEAKRAKEEAEKPMLDKTLGVLKSVFGG